MLTLVPLFFLFGWMLPADFLAVPFRIPQQVPKGIPLSMVEDSIDDMYFGCQTEMMEKVQKNYLRKEMRNQEFKKAWSRAAKCATKKPDGEDKALTKAHMQAICVYSRNDIYKMFNDAVRTQGPDYQTTFKFHSLHFLLTSAVQILNQDHHCHTTYRRTESTFTGRVNERIRFGAFASSSYKTDLTRFGHQTCFKIQTCFGADLKNYPVLGDHEKEVLIPPYETFKVTKKSTGQDIDKELEDCEVVYELKSVGIVSRLNCKAVTS
ncbi:ecto-ADP-ribosyltransferase 4-like [Halichoeres trimaculatus]|uniref:ecto-ADP-ribosyltransferase 4-like n=1 Tax=Halichoeres trimaculatus TaxID=147232 RepID=UPI003D9E8B5A